MPGDNPLTAAGGVLWRVEAGQVEILMVHRPGYQDWSLPKGKPDAGENAIQTAAREVTEETGLPFRVGVRLGQVDYLVGAAKKSVSYWSMRLDPASAGDPVSCDPEEVDDFRWVSVPEGHRKLTYPTDRHVLERFNRIGTVPVSVILLRHAHAGSRKKWDGPDDARPLSDRGERQARAIARTLPAFGPTGVLTAPLVRCEQTVAGLGKAVGVRPRTLPALADNFSAVDPDETLRVVARLATSPGPIVACSQGTTMEGVLTELLPTPDPAPTCRKGGMWVLGAQNRRVVTADYYPRLVTG